MIQPCGEHEGQGATTRDRAYPTTSPSLATIGSSYAIHPSAEKVHSQNFARTEF